MAHQPSRRPLGGLPARLAVLAAFLAHLASPAVAATLIESLAGRWTTRAGPELMMEWSPQGAGFDLRFRVADGDEIRASFAPADRPGLFFTERDRGWSMFGTEQPPNPLLDGPLQWARTTPEALYVYRLAVDPGGGFVIDRFACRPAADGLEVDFQRRLPGGRTEGGLMRLARAPS